MSILINMEMPISCGECELCACYVLEDGTEENYRCPITMYPIHDFDKRHEHCPLIPIPEHGRLIDADALHEELLKLEYVRENEWHDGVREAHGVYAARKEDTMGKTLEYITKDQAREKFCSMCRWDGTDNCSECEHPIDDIPAADVAPRCPHYIRNIHDRGDDSLCEKWGCEVKDVQPVRHGRWIETTQPSGWEDVTCAECSECGEDFVLDEWGMDDMKNLMLYCPNCGAKMEASE